MAIFNSYVTNYQRVKFWDGWKYDDFKCRSLVNPILLIDDLVNSLVSLVISSYVSPEEKAGKIICHLCHDQNTGCFLILGDGHQCIFIGFYIAILFGLAFDG